MFPRIKLQTAVEIDSARVIVDIRPCETAGAIYQYAINGPAKPAANRAPPIDVVAGMNFEVGTGFRDEGFGKIVIGGGTLNVGNCTEDKRIPLPVSSYLSAAEDTAQLKLVNIANAVIEARLQADLIVTAEGIAEIAADVEAGPIIDCRSFYHIRRSGRRSKGKDGG